MPLATVRRLLFSARLESLLCRSLRRGERVVWRGGPDAVATVRIWRYSICAGAIWLTGLYCIWSPNWLGEFITPMTMLGICLLVAPFLMALQSLQTLFVITDRRAMILRVAWRGDRSDSVDFGRMDDAPELLSVSEEVAHLNFASGMPTGLPDTDYTGRYGFRFLPDATGVLETLLATRSQGRTISARDQASVLAKTERGKASRA